MWVFVQTAICLNPQPRWLFTGLIDWKSWSALFHVSSITSLPFVRSYARKPSTTQHLHTCRLLAGSRREVTVRIITTIERGYVCFPRGRIWMEFKTILLVGKTTSYLETKTAFQLYRITSLCVLMQGQFLYSITPVQGTASRQVCASLIFISHRV